MDELAPILFLFDNLLRRFGQEVFVGKLLLYKGELFINLCDFFFDPLMYVLGNIKGTGGGKGIQMSAGIHFEEDGIVMTDFNLPRMLKVLFDLEVFRVDQAFSYSNVVPIMVKVRDNLAGRVTDNELIWKTLTKEDKQKLNKGAEHAKKILKNAGASKVYKSWILAAHPGGTVKLGEHVDSNLQTDIENLYVCDASVIPEEWGLPPTLTILSLGKRLAKHILALDKPGDKEGSVVAVSSSAADSTSAAIAQIGTKA